MRRARDLEPDFLASVREGETVGGYAEALAHLEHLVVGVVCMLFLRSMASLLRLGAASLGGRAWSFAYAVPLSAETSADA